MGSEELREIHQSIDEGKLEVINFILKFLDEDKKDAKKAFVQEKKEGYINEMNEESWKDIEIGRDSLQDRIEQELDELKETLKTHKESEDGE